MLLNYNVATKSSRMESWDDESRRVPISAHCCTPYARQATAFVGSEVRHVVNSTSAEEAEQIDI